MRLSKMILTVAGTRIKTMDMHETLRKVISLDLGMPVQSSYSMHKDTKRNIKVRTHKDDRKNSKRELAFQLNDCEGRCYVEGRKHKSWYV